MAKKKTKTIKAYRIIDRKDGVDHALFHGTQGTRAFKKGVWHEADEKIVRDGSSVTSYTSGFHILLSKEAAQEFLEKNFRTRLERLKVIPVLAREIRPKSHSRSEVYLAKYMKLI